MFGYLFGFRLSTLDLCDCMGCLINLVNLEYKIVFVCGDIPLWLY